MVLVAVQLPVLGLYLPPVLKTVGGSHPPQTIISLPVHTAEGWNRRSGTLFMLVGFQLSPPGLYLPPVSRKSRSSHPPQMITSLPVQTDEG